ncbi:hypothetical protein C1645_878392 [Glomus cerebriforme]|uniref:Protein kinase domain-containing protein n=1 Tax=Glomus cerebriforme TaxID=658196 RepID=A0A397SL27_9GLOM|nr:hypothetical protein C1645_878392 [Glomus cerebriforme]
MSNGITSPDIIVEWIPYSNLQNINYLTKGGCSEIYTADWIGGKYYKWNSEEQQLERCRTKNIIIKRLENVKSANISWFDEVLKLDINLRKYLQQNHNKLTWKDRIKITFAIINDDSIHREKTIHGDLHSVVFTI